MGSSPCGTPTATAARLSKSASAAMAATSIGLHSGYLYFGRDTAIERYRMRPNSLVPDESPEVVATLPDQQGHRAKGFVFDGEGGMFVNVGAPSNACQPGGRVPEEAGEDPCPLLESHGGVVEVRRERRGPDAGNRHALRDGHGGRTLPWRGTRPRAGWYLVQHGRDQLNSLWPGRFTDEQRAPSSLRKNS